MQAICNKFSGKIVHVPSRTWFLSIRGTMYLPVKQRFVSQIRENRTGRGITDGMPNWELWFD